MRIRRSLGSVSLLILLACIWFSTPEAATKLKEPVPLQAMVAIDTELLCQHWLHSFEETKKTAQGVIYRPEGFKQFPASRFRMQYRFHKNGRCEWYYLSPDDAHTFKEGNWRIDAKNKNILRISKGEITESYKVVKLTKDLLQMVPVADR